MAIITKDQKKSEHWYTKDGQPMHRLPKSSGNGDRDVTIKDARRLHLLPSVTSILKMLAAPGLETWRQNQVILAGLRCPKTPEESEEYYCKRVHAAAFEQVDEAADLGSKIHGALESVMAGKTYAPELAVYVNPVVAWKKQTGIVIVEREIRLVNAANGFAGTSDVMFRYGENGIGILDYKTKKTEPGKPVKAFEDQALQLAAYAATYWGVENLDRVLAANIFVSRTEPGRIEVIKHTNMLRHWQAFQLVAALWRYAKEYDPRQLA